MPERMFEGPDCPDDDGVLRRLADLQVPLAVLREALRRGFLAGDFCHAAHPRTYRGLRVYHEINGEFRSEMALRTWHFNDDENIPRVVRPDGAVVITAVSGNERTGIHGFDAQTRRPRGEAGIRMVEYNGHQLALIEMLPEKDPERAEIVAASSYTWFLLYNRVGDAIRSELSLAEGVTEDGGLLKWVERLIMPEFNLYDPPTDMGTPDGPTTPDVDVPVTRRSA